MHYEGDDDEMMAADAYSEPQQTHRHPRRPVLPGLPITFAEQHGANAVPAKYSMEMPYPLPAKAVVSRKVSDALRLPENFPDFPDYQVASSLRSSQSGRSSVSSVPSTTVTYRTKETTARGLFRKRKTVIDCGIINKFDNG